VRVDGPEVVVVGAGIAGLVAANRAAQLGKRVVVLEKSTEQKYRSNSRYTYGTFHIHFTGVDADETGTAGVAGLLALALDGVLGADESVAVVLNGVRRHPLSASRMEPASSSHATTSQRSTP